MADTSARRRLLELLADGGWHSGEQLAASLGLSRAAVWKHLRRLREWGLDIERRPGAGYRLGHAPELLSEQGLRALLPAPWKERLVLELHEQIDSTNHRLFSRLDRDGPWPRACLTEYQSAGRGRRGREWRAAYGEGICLSLAWRFEALPEGFTAMAPALAAAAAQAMEAAGAPRLQLKWPNDLLCGGRKLGGILIELRGEPPGPCAIVAGIGVNWRLPSGLRVGLDQAVTDLASECGGRPPSRNRLIADLLAAWCEALSIFPLTGFEGFRDAWEARDLLAGRRVRIEEARGATRGVAVGLDASGALRMRLADGRERLWHGGEVSLRGEDG
jgi:BirA family biotin operon repressor/biotin-[acetyl-CoA-carboxylase] ligase